LTVIISCINGVCPPCATEETSADNRRFLLAAADTVIAYVITQTLGSSGGANATIIEQALKTNIADALALDVVKEVLETPEAQEVLAPGATDFYVGKISTEVAPGDSKVESVSPTSSKPPSASPSISPSVFSINPPPDPSTTKSGKAKSKSSKHTKVSKTVQSKSTKASKKSKKQSKTSKDAKSGKQAKAKRVISNGDQAGNVTVYTIFE